MTPNYVLYTYETVNGALVCHAYTEWNGTALTEDFAQAAARNLTETTPGLQFMVLPAENLEME